MTDSHDGHHPPPRPLVRIASLMASERRDIWAIVLFAFCVAVLSLATPIAIETLVNTVAFGVLLQPVLVLALVLFACLSLAAFIRAMNGFLVEYLQQRLFVRVASDFARRLPHVRLEAYDRQHGPELLNRFFDVVNLQKSATTLLTEGIAIAVSTIVGMIVLAFYHPALLGFDIALLIALSVLIFGLGRGGIRTSIEESHCKYHMAAWLQELARRPRTFKFYGGPELALRHADKLAHDYVQARRAHFRVVWRQVLFALSIQVVASSALLGLGGYLVVRQQLNLGQLVAAELIVTLIVSSFAKLGKQIQAFYDMCAGVEKVAMVTALPLESDQGEPFPQTAGGMALEVRPRATGGRFSLDGSHWLLRPGEKVALVGRPGSGKSMFLELICGLREPEYGQLRVDGIDLCDLRLSEVRRHIALVRDPDVIAETVLDNLRLGRNDIGLAEIRRALEAVNLLGEIHALPEGLNTELLPNGSPLSSSQAIRLCLARAMLGSPRLMVIDGALDSLNLNECPDLLPALFDDPQAAWTMLVVTTRQAVIERCGRTLELGQPHSALEMHP